MIILTFILSFLSKKWKTAGGDVNEVSVGIQQKLPFIQQKFKLFNKNSIYSTNLVKNSTKVFFLFLSKKKDWHSPVQKFVSSIVEP
jgi:hypothetical protein